MTALLSIITSPLFRRKEVPGTGLISCCNTSKKDFRIEKVRNDSLIFLQTKSKKIGFFLKDNLERKIFHTQQVELNGFIHSILYGTEKENEGYEYFGRRAYSKFIVSLSAQ